MKAKITKKIIEKLKDGEKVQDSECLALFVVAGPQKKSWIFQKKWKYKKFYKVIGDATIMAREEAVQICTVLESRLIQFGALEEKYQVKDRKKVTFCEVLKMYAKEHSGAVKTASTYLQGVMDLRMEEITKELLTDIHKKISKTGPVAANRTIQVIRAAINVAMTEGMIPEGNNPAAKIKMNEEKPRQRYLLPSEVPAVIAELEKMRQDPVYRNGAEALLLMLYTWQRKSNVLAMMWREIDETGIWTIPAAKAKARKDITVALIPQALAILESRRPYGGEYVFPGPEEGTHMKDCKRTWHTVCKRCNIEDCHIHDLRHTGATYALKAGADIATISAALAHASVSFTAKVYAHVMTESKLQAAQGAFAEMTKNKG